MDWLVDDLVYWLADDLVDWWADDLMDWSADDLMDWPADDGLLCGLDVHRPAEHGGTSRLRHSLPQVFSQRRHPSQCKRLFTLPLLTDSPAQVLDENI